MSKKLLTLQKRLAKVEEVVEAKWQKKVSKCNCRLATPATPGLEREFLREMLLRCPAHGYRDLGIIRYTVNPNGTPQTSPTLDALVAICETGPKNPAKCNCRLGTPATSGLGYEFAVGMELRCPTHGQRNLGNIKRYFHCDSTKHRADLGALFVLFDARQLQKRG
jgi:hypothetical protein